MGLERPKLAERAVGPGFVLLVKVLEGRDLVREASNRPTSVLGLSTPDHSLSGVSSWRMQRGSRWDLRPGRMYPSVPPWTAPTFGHGSLHGHRPVQGILLMARIANNKPKRIEYKNDHNQYDLWS